MWIWSLSSIYVLLGKNDVIYCSKTESLAWLRHDVIWENNHSEFYTITFFLFPVPSLHFHHLFAPSCCCIYSTGGAVWECGISLFCYNFYSPPEGLPGVWFLVQSVSKIPRLPSGFLTSSPPWDRALYIFPTESGCQVSCITTQFLYHIFALCLDLCPPLYLNMYVQ